MTILRILSILPILLLTGCETTDTDTDTDDTPEPLAIIGSYNDDFGGTHAITADTWTQGGFGSDSVFHISQYDNAALYAIAENDAANEYNASLWSRFDWTIDADSKLWFCQSSFDSADEGAAVAVAPADASDLTTGCGGFGWSGMAAAR